MTSYLLAVDPGYKKTGIALFEGDRLTYSALVEITKPDRDLAKHWQHTACAIGDIWETKTQIVKTDLAVELMQIDGRTGKAQARQLLRLSGLAGALTCALNGEAYGYPPSTWNKNRSKGPNHAKILRALDNQEKIAFLKGEKFTDGEAKNLCGSLRPKIQDTDTLYRRAVDERTGQAEHALDAVGIGLYHLGRLR